MKGVVKVEPYPWGVMAGVMMAILKMLANESATLIPARNRVLKRMNEMSKRCTKNCLTSMVPHGTYHGLGYGLVEHHTSYENPPDLPAFKTPQPKKHKESLTEALAGAAVAFASAMSGGSKK